MVMVTVIAGCLKSDEIQQGMSRFEQKLTRPLGREVRLLSSISTSSGEFWLWS